MLPVPSRTCAQYSLHGPLRRTTPRPTGTSYLLALVASIDRQAGRGSCSRCREASGTVQSRNLAELELGAPRFSPTPSPHTSSPPTQHPPQAPPATQPPPPSPPT